MVSGCQLQVAKLAQMCPAAPSGSQWHPAAHNGAQWRPAVLSGGKRWPAVTWVKTRVEQNPGQNLGGAPWSTKCPFKTNSPSFYVRLKKGE